MICGNPYSAPSQPRLSLPPLGDLELVTAPVGAVIPSNKAKLWLRVEVADDDELVDELVDAATLFVQQEISGHRQFLTATYDLPMGDWWDYWDVQLRPGEGRLRLPRPPLQSVVSLKYYDSGGVQQTLDPSVYLVRTPFRAAGTVERAPFQAWPAIQADRRWPITIRFTCGYGTASQVPGTIRTAIKMLIAHWYEKREAVAIGPISKEVELSVRALLDSEGYGSYR